MNTIECVGCGGRFPEILAREYSNSTYSEVHRLSVDSYPVQHPGPPSRQSIQSVGVHLIRLCLFLEYGLSAENANGAILEATKRKHSFVWLEPPVSLGQITVADVVKARSVTAHKNAVRAWAQCAWDAWLPHHDTVRGWLPAQPVEDRRSGR